jgi:hypothetical protein
MRPALAAKASSIATTASSLRCMRGASSSTSPASQRDTSAPPARLPATGAISTDAPDGCRSTIDSAVGSPTSSARSNGRDMMVPTMCWNTTSALSRSSDRIGIRGSSPGRTIDVSTRCVRPTVIGVGGLRFAPSTSAPWLLRVEGLRGLARVGVSRPSRRSTERAAPLLAVIHRRGRD